MHFPRFWNAARSGPVVTWGWSDTSADDALAVARVRQERVFSWIKGGFQTELGLYGYPDRPMREEVLREFTGVDGMPPRAAITRNSYGCLVLNTAGLLFVDVDTPTGSIGGFLRALIGRKSVDPQTALEQKLLARAERWVQEQPGSQWRVYRTAAGVRLVATHRSFAPDDPVTQQAFEAFEADRLYRALCKNQRCFRARLTPKPWRCGSDKPPCVWPWADEEAEQRFRVWEKEYLSRALDFATCKLIGEVGHGSVPGDLAELIAVHDEGTRATSDLPLA